MVALGTKIDYIKDAIINTAGVLWLIYSSSVLLVNSGKIAGMIDEPIRCGVPSAGNLSSRQLMIRENCEVVDGEYYIPHDAWTGERTWFDFFLVNAWFSFVLFSLAFFVYSIFMYHVIFTAESEEDRHSSQTQVDQVRSQYMLGVTSLSFNFFFLYAVVLNKLTAFGAWDGISATEVFDSKLDSATVVVQDPESWDTESFLPDFNELFGFPEPDTDHQQYVGAFVHRFVVYCGMSFLKNAFVAIIGLVTDDWHIISLACAAIPTTVVIILFYMPYMASFYLFKLVALHFYLDFDFEFNHTLRTCVFGGIVFGMGIMPQIFAVWVQAALAKAAQDFDAFIAALKERGQEPGCADLAYMKLLAYGLSQHAVIAWPLLSLFGIIGLSCLGYCKDAVGTENATATFNFILAILFITWAIASALMFAHIRKRRNGSSISLSHGVTYDGECCTTLGAPEMKPTDTQ